MYKLVSTQVQEPEGDGPSGCNQLGDVVSRDLAPTHHKCSFVA